MCCTSPEAFALTKFLRAFGKKLRNTRATWTAFVAHKCAQLARPPLCRPSPAGQYTPAFAARSVSEDRAGRRSSLATRRIWLGPRYGSCYSPHGRNGRMLRAITGIVARATEE